MSRSLDSKLSSQLEESAWSHGVIGATAAVDLGPGKVWTGAAGNAHLQNRIPMDAEQRFLIYSNTKTFIALSILKLAESGELDLDEHLSNWFPKLPIGHNISIRQLLNHTSGIPDYGALTDYHQAVKAGLKPWTFDEMIERCCLGELDFIPGHGWRYSNTGYAFLSKLIERISEHPAPAFIHDQILIPLELTETFAVSTKEQLGSLVCGYSRYLSSNEIVVDVRTLYDPRWMLPGVLASNASEIAQFYRELFTGGMLGTDMIEQMCTILPVPHGHHPFTTASYGLGLMADPDTRYGIMYGHTGDGPGYCSAAYHFPDVDGRHITITVLCNSEGSERAELIMFDLMNALTD